MIKSDMKHLLLGGAIALLMSAAACNDKPGPQLSAQAQEQVTAAETAVAKTAETSGNIDALIAQMEQVPAPLKKDTASGFPLAYHKMVTFKPKHDAVRDQQEDMKERLKTLAADIAAGKIKGEDAQKELAILEESLKKIGARADGYQKFYEEMSAEFAKISSTYKAKNE